MVVHFRAMHELVRVRFEFAAGARMVVQILVEARMIVHELLIVDQ